MWATAAGQQISGAEYLRNPDYERLELVDGVLADTGGGGKNHACVKANCASILCEYVSNRCDLWAAVSLSCRLSVAGAEHYRLPDVAVVAGSPDEGDPRFLEGAPLLVVEVGSPENTLSGLMRKLDEYFANGCRIAWLMLPEDESVTVRTASGASATLVKGETLAGGDVLPGFSLPVEKLFE